MYAATPTAASAPILLSDRPLATAHLQWIDRIFAPAIVRCMNEGRRPSNDEIDAVAARIWSDIQPGPRRIPWNHVMPGCGLHRRLVAVARAALGHTKHDGEPP
jgi:hypothetical protein